MLVDSLNDLPNGALKHICSDPSRKYEWDTLETLWTRFESYADTNFKTAIASDFQSHLWEMYLAVTLLDLGFRLRSRHELGNEGPDICVAMPKSNIWIEAIACGSNPADFEDSEDDCEPIDEQVILRYSSAIDAKFKKYKKYLDKDILSRSDPYLIAINGYRIPFSLPVNDSSSVMIPNIIKAVAPFGNYTMIMDRDTKEIIKTGYSYRDKIPKISGNMVTTNIFCNQEYAGISAILFSNIGISNLSDKRGDDLLFFRNPMASNPLITGWLKAGVEYSLKGKKLSKKNWKQT